MSPSLKRAALVAAALATAGCQKNETTPRGTAVLSWSWGGAHEVGPRVIKDITVHARPDHKGAVKVALHVEAAPVELGVKVNAHHTAPVVVRGTIAQNTDFTIKARCDAQPSVRLPSMVAGNPVTPEEMLLGCSLHLSYEDRFNELSYTVSLEVSGDGSVKPSMENGWVALE